MSLGIAIKGPEGIVLAADSRVTLSAKEETPDGTIRIRDFNFDNSHKLLHFSDKENHGFVGAVTYGAAIIPNTLRTAHSFFQEFEKSFKDQRLKVKEYATRLGEFYLELWKEHATEDHKGNDMFFIVGGYDKGDVYGKVFVVSIPSQPEPQPRNKGETNFGMTWGGQLKIPSRLIGGIDPEMLHYLAEKLGLKDIERKKLEAELKGRFEYRIPFQVLPLQDCIDLAILLIRTTAGIQSRAAVQRGVGGMVDVATITRSNPLYFIQQKQLRGEDNPTSNIGG